MSDRESCDKEAVIAIHVPVPRAIDSTDLPPLDIRQIHYFIAVAEEGSISAAAASLGLAQPTLSENLARLERRLGVPLVQRAGRGIQLTEAGKLFAERSRALVAEAVATIAEARQTARVARGNVSIGLPPSLSMLLSVPIAETIQNEQQGIHLKLTEALSGDIIDWVATERVDFGCVYELPHDKDIIVRPLLVEKLFLVSASDDQPEGVMVDEYGHATILGANLNLLPLVLPSGSHGARKFVERFARGAGIDLNIVTEIDSLSQIVRMVSRASGHTILPHAAVIEEVADGTLSLVEIVPSMSRTAYLVRKRSKPVTMASAIVEEAVVQIIGEMVTRYKLDVVVHAKHGDAEDEAKVR